MSEQKPIQMRRLRGKLKPKGRVVNEADQQAVKDILAALAARMNLPMVAVYEVITRNQ